MRNLGPFLLGVAASLLYIPCLALELDWRGPVVLCDVLLQNVQLHVGSRGSRIEKFFFNGRAIRASTPPPPRLLAGGTFYAIFLFLVNFLS